MDNLKSRIIEEILLLQDCFLTHLPGGGRGLRLAKMSDEDLVLLWSSGKVYRIVQGEWLPVADVPMPILLKTLKFSLEKRRSMAVKRISKMTADLKRFDDAISAAQTGEDAVKAFLGQ